MAVSIDARVGQREIDAAREGGADIEGVTSMQGTPVESTPAQGFVSRKGLLNQEPTHVSIDDIVNSLHPDFVANASPQELDYAISIVQGKAKYEEGALSGPTVSRQPPWAGTKTQTTGTGITELEDAVTAGKKADDLIAWFEKEIEKNKATLKDMQRWYTSPARAEALLGPPLGSGNMPTYSGTPTVVEDESAWGAGDYLGAPTFVEDESAWGAGGYTPVNPFATDRPLEPGSLFNTFEEWQDFVENKTPVTSFDSTVDISKDKTTAKAKYGAWKGKFNKLEAEKNLENLSTFRKGWMTDFENKFGSAQHWGLTRPTVNGKQISVKDNRLRNQVMRTDEFLNAYDSVYGTNKGAKMIGNALSRGVGTVGNMAQSFVNKKGAGNADKFSTTLRQVEDGEYGGGAEVAPTHPRDTVSGGFWGLMSFAKDNKKLFKSLSGEELWALVSDPDEFWQFYEDALNAQ